MSEIILKKQGFWSFLLFFVAGGLLYFVGLFVYLVTPELMAHATEIVMYGLPLGEFVLLVMVILILFAGVAILGGIRGLISAAAPDRFEKHKINKVFSWFLVGYGGFFIFSIILLNAMTDFSALNLYLNGEPNRDTYIGILTAIYMVLGVFGGLIIFAGVRGLKVVRSHGFNKPNIMVKIFAILLVVVIIAGFTQVPALLKPSPREQPTIPSSYTRNIGPVVEFGPYDDSGHVIASTSTSVVIWWFTANETDGMTLKYGTSSNPASMQSVAEIDGGDNKRHEVVLDGLQPATTYFYTVPNFSSEVYNFTTGPAPGSDAAFRFICVGDTRNSGGTSMEYYNYLNEVITKHYRDLGEDYAFTINVGDIASSGSDIDSWGLFFDDIKGVASSHAYQVAIGNHELGGDSGANYDYILREPRYYSFDYGNAHFLIINNFDGLITNVDPEQMAFIKQDLERNYDSKFIIVAMHVPPLSTGDFNMNPILISQLVSVFREYKVDVVLTGHDHHYDAFWIDRDSDWNGTFYFVNGGGGAPLDHYIMTRQYKTWKAWYHNRSSEYGLYQHDKYTDEGHIYGELSHGFMEIKVESNKLTMTYFRWLDLYTYFNITGQDHSSYNLVPLNQTTWNTYNLDQLQVVHVLEKTRNFG
ncbi:MAG: fibronectin type III domain-containing protein [Promethearchaeota archaeon]